MKTEEHFNELYCEAKTLVLEAGMASTGLLQEKFRIRYRVAATVMNKLESEGIIAPYTGELEREVISHGKE